MRITVCRSTDRVTATVLRELDDDQRRLIICDQLTSEAATLAAAFDLDGPDGAA